MCNSRVGHQGSPALTQAVETALLTRVMPVQVEAGGTNCPTSIADDVLPCKRGERCLNHRSGSSYGR